jgi:threonylcarbamoyladenosine tRNA methylthiotransferase MtaB
MGRTAWTLRVQTGCEERCSYCIIPTTRGASRSRTLEDVGDEAGRVIAAGYKEIVITGVHLGAYGRDLTPRSSLTDLLRRLVGRTETAPAADSTSPRDVLYRISSLEPMDFPLDLLELPVAPHFHLPLQHASNRVLEQMRRPYTIESYDALVTTIQRRLPHAAIGADVIAGFPGESDEDFDRLARYLAVSPITHVHVFPYSDRPGTAAAGLGGKVHGSIVKARAHRLREISRVLSERFRAAQAGSARPALTIEDGSIAVTDNYFRVAVPAGHGRNEWVTVRL